MSSNSNNKLHRVQKVADQQNSWRTSCKRKRQMEASTSQSTPTDRPSKLPFQLDKLPLNTLVIVASQLPFGDFKNIGSVSKKLNTAQRTTRYSRKKISVDLLRQLFPDEPLPPPNVPHAQASEQSNIISEHTSLPTGNSSIGMLQVMRPLRSTLRSSPPRNINEVDLSEFGAFRESHFDELLKSVHNGQQLFGEVRRLNIRGCVVELKDMEFLAQLMPKIWFIRYSIHTLVLPENVEQKTLSAEQMQQLRARVDNFAQLSRQFTRKQLWFLAQLTELFPCLEEIQLDNC